jgi:hypothetical protein
MTSCEGSINGLTILRNIFAFIYFGYLLTTTEMRFRDLTSVLMFLKDSKHKIFKTFIHGVLKRIEPMMIDISNTYYFISIESFL